MNRPIDKSWTSSMCDRKWLSLRRYSFTNSGRPRGVGGPRSCPTAGIENVRFLAIGKGRPGWRDRAPGRGTLVDARLRQIRD